MLSTFNRNGRRVTLSDRVICNTIFIAGCTGLAIAIVAITLTLDAIAHYGAANPLAIIPIVLAPITIFRLGSRR